MSTFQKNNSNSIQLHTDGTCTDDPGNVDEAFAKHFIQPIVTLHHLLVPFQFFVLIFYH